MIGLLLKDLLCIRKITLPMILAAIGISTAFNIGKEAVVIEKYVLGLPIMIAGMLAGAAALAICNLIEPWDIDVSIVGVFYVIGIFGGYISIGAPLHIDHRLGSQYLGIALAATVGAIAGLAAIAVVLFFMNIRIIESKDF